MKSTSLILYDTDNNQKTISLRLLIAKRKQLLIKKMNKLELLKNNLFYIEQEYENRVGTLQRRGMFLEFEILRIKRIHDLMRVGLTYKEALIELEEIDIAKKKWSNERDQFRHDNQHISFGPTDYQAIIDDVKSLWKKLVRQFHPDLTEDKDEKKEREEMMKKINNAFASNDLQTLKAIDAKKLFDEDIITPAIQLEKMLDEIENALITLDEEMSALKETQWYSWHRAGVHKRKQLLQELESGAQDEIVRKEKLLNELKKSLPI